MIRRNIKGYSDIINSKKKSNNWLSAIIKIMIGVCVIIFLVWFVIFFLSFWQFRTLLSQTTFHYKAWSVKPRLRGLDVLLRDLSFTLPTGINLNVPQVKIKFDQFFNDYNLSIKQIDSISIQVAGDDSSFRRLNILVRDNIACQISCKKNQYVFDCALKDEQKIFLLSSNEILSTIDQINFKHQIISNTNDIRTSFQINFKLPSIIYNLIDESTINLDEFLQKQVFVGTNLNLSIQSQCEKSQCNNRIELTNEQNSKVTSQIQLENNLIKGIIEIKNYQNLIDTIFNILLFSSQSMSKTNEHDILSIYTRLCLIVLPRLQTKDSNKNHLKIVVANNSKNQILLNNIELSSLMS